MIDILIATYTGTQYSKENNLPPYIINLIQPNIVKNSFRTKLIPMVNNKYYKAYENSEKNNGLKKNYVMNLIKDPIMFQK